MTGMVTGVSPDSYTQAEIVRSLERIEGAVAAVSAELHGQGAQFVPREVWDEAWRALGDWKAMITTDVVNIDAALTRHIRDSEQKREQIVALVERRAEAERVDRVSGQRWALGLAMTGILGLIGTLLSITNVGV